MNSSASVVERLFSAPQYGLVPEQKNALLERELARLTTHHAERCAEYRRMLDVVGGAVGDSEADGLAATPFVPARAFKAMSLRSVPEGDVVRVLVSSGTTSDDLTRVVLDRETATLQTRALAAIMTSFIGPKRLPMVLVDTPSMVKGQGALSARGAGLVGMATFGRKHFYALDDEMRVDLAGLEKFLGEHPGERVLLFGFTFMVWRYLYEAMKAGGVRFDNAILIHSGGWKKLQDLAVTNEVFKRSLAEELGITPVHNFYGMVEQVGSVYMECEAGWLHAPNFADLVVRDHRDWRALPPGEIGVIETLSVLPRSYPGHAILTEDLGIVRGLDGCPCGRRGTYFSVLGRVARAELRGCSDTHAAVAA